jgi:hypothetical protein
MFQKSHRQPRCTLHPWCEARLFVWVFLMRAAANKMQASNSSCVPSFVGFALHNNKKTTGERTVHAWSNSSNSVTIQNQTHVYMSFSFPQRPPTIVTYPPGSHFIYVDIFCIIAPLPWILKLSYSELPTFKAENLVLFRSWGISLCMGLVGQSEGYWNFERSRRKYDYEIRYIKKPGGNMDLIRITPNRNQWQTSENKKTKLRFSYSGRNSMRIWRHIGLRSRNLQHESLIIKLVCCLLRLIYFVFITFVHYNSEIYLFLFSQAFWMDIFSEVMVTGRFV